MAAEGGVSVGEHLEWYVLGWTINTDTVISTLIAAVIVLFFFILISNWLAIVPHAWEEYVRPPTADVNLTFALSFFVIILVHATGMRVQGRHYLKHVFSPFNLLEELSRPVTLSLRLFGNMLAGTVMLGVIALPPQAVSWLPATAWKLFDLFIGLLQALIFALLTILYFGFAAGSHGDEHS